VDHYLEISSYILVWSITVILPQIKHIRSSCSEKKSQNPPEQSGLFLTCSLFKYHTVRHKSTYFDYSINHNEVPKLPSMCWLATSNKSFNIKACSQSLTIREAVSKTTTIKL